MHEDATQRWKDRAVTPLPAVAPVIQTHFLGPTNRRGSRVVARNVSSGGRQVANWDPALGPAENHFLVAKATLLANYDGWRIVSMCSVDGGGYIFSTELIR